MKGWEEEKERNWNEKFYDDDNDDGCHTWLSLITFWSPSFHHLFLSVSSDLPSSFYPFFSPSYINQSHFNPSHSLPPLSHYLHLIHIRFILDVMTRWRNRLIFLPSFSTCFKKQKSREGDREGKFYLLFSLSVGKFWWWSVSCLRIQWRTFLK